MPPVRRFDARAPQVAGAASVRDDPASQLHPVIDAELVEDAREVALDRPFGDEEAPRDLGVRRPAGHERRDLPLPAGQAIARRRGSSDVRLRMRDGAFGVERVVDRVASGQRLAEPKRCLERGVAERRARVELDPLMTGAERLEDRRRNGFPERLGDADDPCGPIVGCGGALDQAERLQGQGRAHEVVQVAADLERAAPGAKRLGEVASSEEADRQELVERSAFPGLAEHLADGDALAGVQR